MKFNFESSPRTVEVIRTRFPCSGLLDFLRNLFFFKKIRNEIWTKIFGNIKRGFRFAFIQAIIFLKLTRILTKIDISLSNFNTRALDPPVHSHQFDANCGKIRYVSDP